MRKDLGFLRIAAFSPVVAVGDVETNLKNIIECIKSDECNSDILLFPELCLTGYTCGDLFMQDKLLEQVWNGLQQELQNCSSGIHRNKLIVVGAPIQHNNSLYNFYEIKVSFS